MKNLYSISGLLPAQFRADPASNGIGWTTINARVIKPEGKIKNMDMVDEHECFAHHDLFEKEVDSKEPEYECLECGDSGRSHPTLANPDGEVCKCVKDDNEINVGDWVQVLPDNIYGNSDCKLNPGGIYVVRKIEGGVFKLSEQIVGSWIRRYEIRKIDLRIGTRVKTLDEITPPGHSTTVSGIGKITEIGRTYSMPYKILMDDKDNPLWFEEGTLTLDD